jgi:hypothetical protein
MTSTSGTQALASATATVARPERPRPVSVIDAHGYREYFGCVRTGTAVQPRTLQAILSAGLLCGTLDITAAFVTWVPRGVTPARLLQGIASGLLGEQSFRGGNGTATLGLVFHFLIALSAAAAFYAASRKLRVLIRRPILSGVLYGVAVYVVMYWIVLPLSRFHGNPFSVSAAAVAIVTHILCVGLPIALVVRRYSR